MCGYSKCFFCHLPSGIPDKENDLKPPQPPSSQTSVESAVSALTDSGFTEITNTNAEFMTRTGFRPLSKSCEHNMVVSTNNLFF